MNRDLRSLIKLGARIGGEARLGGEGQYSVSVKESRDVMLINAGGALPSDMDEHRGWVRIDLRKVNALLESDDIRKMEEGRRERELLDALAFSRVSPFEHGALPAADACLHALLLKYAVRIQPVAVRAVTCARAGYEAALKIFRGIDPPILWVEYADPGYPLAWGTKRALAKYVSGHGGRPKIIFHQNQGLFVNSNNLREVIALAETAVRKLRGKVRKRAIFKRAAAGAKLGADGREAAIGEIALLLRKLGAREGKGAAFVRFSDSPILKDLAFSREGPRLVGACGLAPEQVMHCGKRGAWLGRREVESAARSDTSGALLRLEAHRKRFGVMPKITVARELGAFASGASLDDVCDTLRAFEVATQAMKATFGFGGPAFLTERRAGYIDRWQVSGSVRASYAEKAPGGVLAGRIALVTGAGSGLGRGISIGLARAGAAVALLDIDSAGAEETQETIAEDADGRAVAVAADVTDEAGVVRAFRETLKWAGGLDILVNAAGIAPSFALVDFPLELWQKTLDINLTGYFLAAREAVRIFMKQGLGGSIVNLSSKSGLEASVNNTAYNATKAGEIHLARGWALELGKYSIRANAVAPGNVFKGSKTWNPAYIRDCARKRNIKPEEVIPFYTNLTALKKEIEPADIANAVVFLCSEAARRITGQTIVCDGGQVLVR